MPTTKVKIIVPGHQPMVALLGHRDELLKLIEDAFDTEIIARGNEITISGEEREADQVGRLFEELLTILSQGHSLTAESVAQTISMIREDEVRPSDVFTDVLLPARGRLLAPQTA